MTTYDNDTLVTIEWLQSLPAGAVVRWASDHVTAREPWGYSWVDVRVPDGGPPGMGWVWTICAFETPDDEATDGDDEADDDGPIAAWNIAWPHDLDVHGVWPPDEPWYVNEWVAPRGAPLPKAIAAMYENFPANFGGEHIVRVGWSAAAVTEAVAAWAAVRAGRADLHFEWDADAGPSAKLLEVAARAASLADGAPTWDLGDGVRAVDAAMDDLLAEDPTVAARVVQAAKDAWRMLRRVREEDGPHDPADV